MFKWFSVTLFWWLAFPTSDTLSHTCVVVACALRVVGQWRQSFCLHQKQSWTQNWTLWSVLSHLAQQVRTQSTPKFKWGFSALGLAPSAHASAGPHPSPQALVQPLVGSSSQFLSRFLTQTQVPQTPTLATHPYDIPGVSKLIIKYTINKMVKRTCQISDNFNFV